MRKFIQTVLLSLGLLLIPMITIPNETDGKLYNIVHSEITESLSIMKEFNVSILERENIKQYPILCPINPKDVVRISAFYGERIHPIYNKMHIHRGIDYSAVKGVTVISTGDGIVTGIEKRGGYGKQIVIDHGNGYTSRYAHLHKIFVNKGDTVKIGDTIGSVGSTGLSTGNHLHYEISHQHKTIDPMSIYPSTLQENAYLDYLKRLNNHYTSCSDILSNI